MKSHDFPDPKIGKAITYGVYDVTHNVGWVQVGVDHDTSAFAVAAIRMWWQQMGRHATVDAKELLITADSGGSNGYRRRAWKMELQRLADETGLTISVSHLPPGTSKWNKIEHNMFCHITRNWRGEALVSYEVIVNLIGHTTTRSGLRVHAGLDRADYPCGVKVTKKELGALNLQLDALHGEWNYTIVPTSP